MAKSHGRGGVRASDWRVDCLGVTQVRNLATGDVVTLSPLQRRLVATLALAGGVAVDLETLIDAVWHTDPPSSARASLHNTVSRIRERSYAEVITSTETGYQLTTTTDAAWFEAAVEQASHALTSEPSTTKALLNEALDVWRGEPYCDVEHLPNTPAAVAALAMRRRQAESLRARALLHLGDAATAITEAERLVADTPTDESRWALLADALVAAGRRGDALSAIARATRHLRDALGVAPGPELRELHRRLVTEPARSPRMDTLRPVGREDLIARLVTALDDGESIVIVGEDGSGRTTIAREVWRLMRRRGHRSVYVAAEANAASATSIVDDIFDELGIPRLVGADTSTRFVETLTQEVNTDRIVIVVDDLVHVGPSTLGALAQCQIHPNLQLVATTGLHDGVPPALESLRMEVIEPLDDDAMCEIVRETQTVAGRLNSTNADALVSLAGGNPLLLVHLLEEALATGTPDNAAKSASVSDGLVQTVESLLAPHGPAVRRAVDVASVIGSSGPMSAWEDLASRAGVVGALASGLVEQRHDEFRFRHGAVARVRAASLTSGIRTDIQRGFADIARQRGLPVLVYAHHSVASALLNPAAAFDDCIAAGNDATARGMHRDASDWYGRARAIAQQHFSPDSPRELQARIRSGDALRLCGDPLHLPELLACAEEALRRGDAHTIADAVYALLQFGGTSQRSNEQRRAMHYARRALKALANTEHWALIAAATTLTVSLFDDPAEPRRMFERALLVANNPALRMRILPYAYMTFGHPRDLDRRHATATELHELAHGAGNPSALFSAHHQHWANALVRGDQQLARHHHEAMAVLVDRICTIGARWEHLNSLTAQLIADGEVDAAEHTAREAHDLLAPVMSERAAAVFMSHLFAIRRHQHRLHELEPQLAHVVSRQPSVGALRALYAATLTTTDPERAVAEAIAASHSMHDDFTWLPAQFVVGEVLVATQTIEHAAAHLQLLEPWSHLHAAPLTCSFGPVSEITEQLRTLTTTTC